MKPDLLSTLNKSGSGLNLRDLAQTLATAETAPQINRLQRAQNEDELRLSGLSALRAQLDALGANLVRAAGNPGLSVETSTPALSPKVTDRNAVIPGTVAIDVLALARPQVLEFTGFQSPLQALSTGVLTVDFGAWSDVGFTPSPDRPSLDLTLAGGTTLQGLAETLNRLPGVTAQILDKGDGTFSLGILGDTGTQNAIRLRAADGGTDGVSLMAFDTQTSNETHQLQAAQDAVVSVNGIALTRQGNVLTDVIPGVEIALQGTVSGVIKIDRSVDATRENVQLLISGLNETLALLRDLTTSDAGTGSKGSLAGDRNLLTLESALRRLISQPLSGYADRPVTMADLGIATERSGMLRFDPPAFDRTFAQNASHFDALFENKLRALSGRADISGTPASGLRPGDLRFERAADGTATLDGFSMSAAALPDGRSRYLVTSGPARGLSMTAPADLNSDTIRFGRSFAEQLAILLDDAVSRTGLIGRKETEIDRQNTQRSARVEMLEARAAIVEKRYLSRFAAMEQAVSQMNATSNYLKNLVDMWSSKR